MKATLGTNIHGRVVLAFWAAAFACGRLVAQETNVALTLEITSTPAEPAIATPAEPAIPEPEWIGQFRQQQIEALRAIENLRAENIALSQRNDEAMSTRLKLAEERMSRERAADLDQLRQANRSTLTIVGVSAGAALLCMLIIVLYLLRLLKRLTEAAVFPLGSAFSRPQSATAALISGTGSPAHERLDQAGERFLGLIQRLEKRVNELEHGAPHGMAGEAPQNGGLYPITADSNGDVYPAPVPSEKESRITSLAGKGLTLLNMGQADAALMCYEEIIALDPKNTEALVKKGKALEKLRRMEEALECYDRALALDQNLTIAYLGKGGVYNRLERYAEALACYEKAMQSQQQARVAVPA